MFGLPSRYLRRRLSPLTSGSARRRARERRQAEQTRAEGERLAKENREQRAKERMENQRQIRESLAFEPWGRAGGGAPNPRGIRYSDLRAGEIYPEDELRGVSKPEGLRRWVEPPRRRRRAPLRLREDPQLCYAESLRNSVENDIRYRQTPDNQKSYKEILDDLVAKRKKAKREEKKRDLEYEQMMQAMDGPWGRPGPGGTTWRNPRDIGLNFSKSMGWTDNEILNKMKGEHKLINTSSLTLPQVKRDDDTPEREKPSSVEKLPDINQKTPPKEESPKTKTNNGDSEVKAKRSPRKKFIKRLPNGEKVKRTIPVENDIVAVEENTIIEKKLTPEETILRLTGGIELVPLLARRRMFGARTLPSSDVTRPPEQSCEWRYLNMEYLKDLKHQMKIKCERKEERRLDSAESVRVHHETWASLWGRPGHGAPQPRGRYARHNLARLLYVTPLQARCNI